MSYHYSEELVDFLVVVEQTCRAYGLLFYAFLLRVGVGIKEVEGAEFAQNLLLLADLREVSNLLVIPHSLGHRLPVVLLDDLLSAWVNMRCTSKEVRSVEEVLGGEGLDLHNLLLLLDAEEDQAHDQPALYRTLSALSQGF